MRIDDRKVNAIITGKNCYFQLLAGVIELVDNK